MAHLAWAAPPPIAHLTTFASSDATASFSSSHHHHHQAMTKTELTVGVLALQGAFEEHIDMLQALEARAADGSRVAVRAVAVRLPAQLEGVDALVLPGGESTTMGKVATRWGLVRCLVQCVGLFPLTDDALGDRRTG